MIGSPSETATELKVEKLDAVVAAWSGVCTEFEAAFQAAREDRAAYTPRLNMLEVFGLKTWELSHSRVLAWFLDENASHEQGGFFLDCLLRDWGLEIPTAGYTVQREKPDRVDVVAYKQGTFALFIENKVNHHERERQFADLQSSLIRFSVGKQIPAENRFALFLTDDGRAPSSAHSGQLAGFLSTNLHAFRRLVMFQTFAAALTKHPNKSRLLTTFLDAYVQEIASHARHP